MERLATNSVARVKYRFGVNMQSVMVSLVFALIMVIRIDLRLMSVKVVDKNTSSIKLHSSIYGKTNRVLGEKIHLQNEIFKVKPTFDSLAGLY